MKAQIGKAEIEAYRIYRAFGGHILLVFTDRSAHQFWLANCMISAGGELIDEAGRWWILV